MKQVRGLNSRFCLLVAIVGLATTVGLASRSEAQAGRSPVTGVQRGPYQNPAVEFVRSFDANGDGQIDKAEFLKAYEAMFEIMDVTGDGKIDDREFRRDPARTYSDSARRAEITIQRYDADGDEKLSPDEAPFWTRIFNRADANKDGFVDRRELTQLQFDTVLLSEGLRAENPTKIVHAFLKKYDKNADGKVSKEEFGWDDRTFSRYDRNKDGVLDAGEIVQMPPLPPSPRMRARQMLKMLDRDKNGSLSAIEYAQPPERFHAADTNGDGEISLDELTAEIGRPKTALRPQKSKRLEVRPKNLRAPEKLIKKGEKILAPKPEMGVLNPPRVVKPILRPLSPKPDTKGTIRANPAKR